MNQPVTNEWLAEKLGAADEPDFYTPAPPVADSSICPICGYKPTKGLPAGENYLWECSHVECQNRQKVTAAPGDRVPPPKD